MYLCEVRGSLGSSGAGHGGSPVRGVQQQRQVPLVSGCDHSTGLALVCVWEGVGMKTVRVKALQCSLVQVLTGGECFLLTLVFVGLQ